jgi:2-polyprenyl-6-methoxyphenol hydroxylase-like FAD-dependent oxidoreductase
MSELKVLIVGASIAGPTAAYWFAKAGATVTIIERFPQLRTNGQNVDIRTAGVTVMRRMLGMEAAVRAKTMPIEGISFVRANGRPYGTIRATGNPDQQSLVSEYEILRGDLAQILFDLTKDNKNINYVFGEQVASIQQQEQEDGPIKVEFANGLPTSEFDLVVACDGATSRTRAMGLGCSIRDHVKPTNCWAAYFSIQQDLLDGSKLGQSYSATGGRFIGVGPDPSGANRVVLMGIHPRDDHDATRPFLEAMKRGDDALKQFVAQHYEGAGWKCDEAVKAMIEAQDFYANEIVQIKTPSLYKGRFVLVGDAGYAPGPTGAGTSLAIAGAYVLAGEVGRHKGNLAAGLKGYEEQMRPIIDDLQKIPPLIPTVFAPQTVWGIWLRNTIFAFICWTGILEFAQRFFAGSFANTDKYKLPDYEWVT